eukprot:6212877-Pleurochrysis_carterae.AAC.2
MMNPTMRKPDKAHGDAASARCGDLHALSGLSCIVISRRAPKKRAQYNESCNAWSAGTMRRGNAWLDLRAVTPARGCRYYRHVTENGCEGRWQVGSK